MNKIASVAATILAFGFVTSATAADMPTKAPVAPMVIPFSWAGLYAGVNLGGGWGTSTGDLDSFSASLAPAVAGGAVPASLGTKSSGVIGGAQIGYNWQSGSLVWGVETDIQGSGIRGTSTVNFAGGGGFVPTVSTGEEKITWFGTARLRGGFAIAPRGLIYATGGFAYGGVQNSASVVGNPTTSGNFTGSTSTTKGGWTVGAGTEWAVTNNWLVRAEYLYIDLGSTTVALTDPQFPGSFINYRFRHRDNILRAALSYKF
ncbi:MAG: porin family protein [Rhizobiales bacterium]|nr:porin family protein [Hyphomicrobiales bacterium]